jgi:O-antigen ligase
MNIAAVAIGVVTLITLVVAFAAVRSARAHRDFDAATLLTLGMGLLFSSPIALTVLSGGEPRRPDAFGTLVLAFPGWYEQAVAVAAGTIALLALALIARRLTSLDVPVHAAGLFALLLWAAAHLSALFHGGRLLSPRGAVLLLCLLAAAILPRARGAPLGAGLVGLGFVLASGITAIFRYDFAVRPCETECGVLGVQFSGVFPNENLLGTALLATMPFAYVGFRGAARVASCLCLGATAFATGSRMAALAALIVLAVLAATDPRLDGSGPRRAPSVAWAYVAAAGIGSFLFPWRDWQDAHFLTGRDALWRVAFERVGESPLLGYGAEAWSRLVEPGLIPFAAQRSTHNQWTDVLFAAGWIGVALFVAMIVATLATAANARPAVAIAAGTLLLAGTTEGTWSVTLDWLSFSLVALILTGPLVPEPEAAPRLAREPREPRRAFRTAESPT